MDEATGAPVEGPMECQVRAELVPGGLRQGEVRWLVDKSTGSTVDAVTSASDVLREQIQYYRERATEYDDWFLRLGRYDRGEDATRRWFEQVEEVRQVIRGLPLDGKQVLELAPGTGIWTNEFCARAAHLTAVDASPEMIALNRTRLGSRAEKVSYIEADLFDWFPNQEYDAVVFCF